MKKKIAVKSSLFGIFLLSALVLVWAFASSFCKRDISYDVLPYLASKTPYPKRSLAQSAGLLSECKPIHINHLGRHGSRHLGKTLNEEVVKIIVLASRSGQIKVSGRNVPSLIQSALALENPSSLGQLTDQGREEQRRIAERLYGSYPEVFADPNKPILLRSTRVQRTKDSLNAFWEKLISLKPDLLNRGIITIGETGTCDPHLRFFEGCNAYRDFVDTHPHKQQLEQAFLERVTPRVTSIMRRIFEQPFIDTLEQKTQILIALNFYYLCQLQADLNRKGTKNGFCSLFASASEIEPFSWHEDVSYYLTKGPNSENKIAQQTACVLLKDFIDSSALAIADSKAPAANFRFAHAETIMPFMSLLGFYVGDTFESLLKNPEKRIFRSSEVSPMAANVQWILYRCPSDEYRVRMRHNEKDMIFPIEGCSEADGCSFDLIKNYYERKGRTCDEKTWATEVCEGTSCTPSSDKYL